MAQKAYRESFSADGDSKVYRVRQGAGNDSEPVGFAIAGTWGSGTMTLKVCVNPGAATQVFAPVANGEWSADIGDKLDFPDGAWFKFTLGGSTTPTLTLDVSGFVTQADA